MTRLARTLSVLGLAWLVAGCALFPAPRTPEEVAYLALRTWRVTKQEIVGCLKEPGSPCQSRKAEIREIKDRGDLVQTEVLALRSLLVGGSGEGAPDVLDRLVAATARLKAVTKELAEVQRHDRS